jgi:hypothetical protein
MRTSVGGRGDRERIRDGMGRRRNGRRVVSVGGGDKLACEGSRSAEVGGSLARVYSSSFALSVSCCASDAVVDNVPESRITSHTRGVSGVAVSSEAETGRVSTGCLANDICSCG